MARVDREEPLFGRNKANSPEVKNAATLATRGIDALKVGAPNFSSAVGMTRSSQMPDFAYVGDVLTPDEVIVADRTTAGVDVPQFGTAERSNQAPRENFDRGLMRAKHHLPDMGDKFISHIQLHQNDLRWTNNTSPKGHASKTDAAFGEELRLIGSDKYKNLQKIESQMHRNVQKLQMHSQADEFSSLDKLPGCFADSDEHVLSTSSMGAGSSSLFSQPQRKSSRLLSKRRRPDKNSDLLDWEFEEVQDVVLLDDEDLHGHTKDGSSDECNEVRLYYPSRNVPESVALSHSDMECLLPEQYLSSPIMNFYIQYLQKTKPTTSRTLSEYHIFNTFFYGKLEKALTQKGDRFQYFSKLRRWWKGVNIFSKAYVILPIHGSSHWSLVIICNPGNEDDLYLLILHLDSLGLHLSQQIFRIVSYFLKEEWNYLNQSLTADPPYRKYLPLGLEKKRVMVPQQKNKYDCGLFVLYFIERFLEEAPQRLRKHDLSMFHAKWFKPAEASGLRERIRDLLKNS